MIIFICIGGKLFLIYGRGKRRSDKEVGRITRREKTGQAKLEF